MSLIEQCIKYLIWKYSIQIISDLLYSIYYDRYILHAFSAPNTTAEENLQRETVSSLRHRLKSLKDAFGDDVDDQLLAEADSLMSRTGPTSADEILRSSNRRAAKRRNASNCLESIIDGSFMGGVLAVCLMMVFGAAFFAYKNLYYAVIKKMYPERDEL